MREDRRARAAPPMVPVSGRTRTIEIQPCFACGRGVCFEEDVETRERSLSSLCFSEKLRLSGATAQEARDG